MSEPVTKYVRYEDWYIRPKWFSAETPANATKASAVLVFDGVVSNKETVTIGDDVYEFVIAADGKPTTTGKIPIALYELLNQATNTLTFSGAITNGETVTIGDGGSGDPVTEVYEFVDDVGSYAGDNIVVENDAGAIDNLVAAIKEESELVTAVRDGVNDAVIITAVVRGTAGNAYTVVTDCVNAKFAGEGKSETLAGGLDTVAKAVAATAFVGVAKNSDIIDVDLDVSGTDPEVTVTCKQFGDEGNDIAIAETGTNIAWDGAPAPEKLDGGHYGTPCPMKGIVVVFVDEEDVENYYVCAKAGGRGNVEWKTFTLSDLDEEEDDD